MGLNEVESICSSTTEMWLHCFHVFIHSFSNNSHNKYIFGERDRNTETGKEIEIPRIHWWKVRHSLSLHGVYNLVRRNKLKMRKFLFVMSATRKIKPGNMTVIMARVDTGNIECSGMAWGLGILWEAEWRE